MVFGRLAQESNIVVTQDMNPRLLHQEVRRLPGPERAGEMVTKIDDCVNISPVQVSNDRFQGKDIPMNV
jgi:hypothetical protein